MDLTSLVLFAALVLGLVVGDAAVSGGNLALSISVPQKVADTGFIPRLYGNPKTPLVS